MKEIFESFKKSLLRFKEILNEEKTAANQDSAIQRFEFTSELAWKVVQKFLKEEKIICRSPKECLKEAFKFGLIDDDVKWLEMIDDRNLTSHTYDEEKSEEVYERLPDYLKLLELLKEKVESEKEPLRSQ